MCVCSSVYLWWFMPLWLTLFKWRTPWIKLHPPRLKRNRSFPSPAGNVNRVKTFTGVHRSFIHKHKPPLYSQVIGLLNITQKQYIFWLQAVYLCIRGFLVPEPEGRKSCLLCTSLSIQLWFIGCSPMRNTTTRELTKSAFSKGSDSSLHSNIKWLFVNIYIYIYITIFVFTVFLIKYCKCSLSEH